MTSTITHGEYVKTFSALTMPLLRARAAALNIAGRSKMNKAELVGALATAEVALKFGASIEPAQKLSKWEIHYQRPGYINGIETFEGATLADARRAFFAAVPDGTIVTTSEIEPTPKLSIHTASARAVPSGTAGCVTFTFNLSEPWSVHVNGTVEPVRGFVSAIDGGLDLYLGMISQQLRRGREVMVLVLCRNDDDRHRSVAFAEEIAQYFGISVTHHRHRELNAVRR